MDTSKTKFTQDDINNYIYDNVILEVEKGKPFEYNDIIDKIIKRNASIAQLDRNSMAAEIHMQSIPTDNGIAFKRQLKDLLNQEYIERLNNGSGMYILTDKGKEVQKAGSIKEYKSKKRWKSFWDNAKNTVVYIITPLIAFFSAIYPMFKNESKIDLVQPIKVIVEDTSKENHLDKSSNNTNKADSNSTNNTND